jgi:hypothetical protein
MRYGTSLCLSLAILSFPLWLNSCRPEVENVKITNVSPLSGGPEVPRGGKISLSAQVENPSRLTLKYKWVFKEGNIEIVTDESPVATYIAPDKVGKQIVIAQVLYKGKKIDEKPIEINVIDKSEEKATEISVVKPDKSLSATPTPSLPPNAQLTTDAWDAFNKKNYTEAIAKSEECTDTFGAQALREQREFTASGKPAPPVGAVSEDKKNEIFSRGVLNDVATCYFIKGQSLEKLNRITEAKEAYRNALKFPDARTFDPSGCTWDPSARRWDPPGCGFFWSPAVAASDRLSKLQ